MTYVNIEIYGAWREPDDSITYHREVILFHKAQDLYWALGEKLEELLQKAKMVLCSEHEWFDWNPAAIGAMLIKLTMEDESFQTESSTIFAPFEPSLEIHPLSEYVWRIMLPAESDDYDIRCYRIKYVDDMLQSLQPIEWRSDVKTMQKP